MERVHPSSFLVVSRQGFLGTGRDSRLWRIVPLGVARPMCQSRRFRMLGSSQVSSGCFERSTFRTSQNSRPTSTRYTQRPLPLHRNVFTASRSPLVLQTPAPTSTGYTRLATSQLDPTDAMQTSRFLTTGPL